MVVARTSLVVASTILVLQMVGVGAFSPSLGVRLRGEGSAACAARLGGFAGGRERAATGAGGLRCLAEPVSDAQFQEMVLQSDVPTLVVFWASWCGPCRMLKPVLDEMESDYSGKIKVVQVNTDENQQAATEYGIRSIPTTMLFKGGERVDIAIGAVPKSTLEGMVLKQL